MIYLKDLVQTYMLKLLHMYINHKEMLDLTELFMEKQELKHQMEVLHHHLKEMLNNYMNI